MTDFCRLLANLKRPRLLIRAARFGIEDYRRERDLARLINTQAHATPETALPRLFCEEERMENTRRAGDLGYSLSRHIEVLIALMAEARLLPRDARA